MSVFTNPGSRSTEQAAAYAAAVLNLLGAKDPMDVLLHTVPAIEHARDGLSTTQLTQPEAVGKWSVRHVLQHLADSELVWGYRLRMMLAHDRPQLTGYDQDLWAERLRYDDVDAQQALQDFSVLRASNLRLLAGASREDLKRVAVHAERGEESVAHRIQLYAGHDLLHLKQIARIRLTVTQSQT